MLLIPDDSLELLYGKVLGSSNETLRLYTNDHVPAYTDTLATYTEMVGNGYAPITLDKTEWLYSVTTHILTAQQTAKLFAFDGSTGLIVVYGYYITDDASGGLMWAERFSTPAYTVNDGDKITVVPLTTYKDSNS